MKIAVLSYLGSLKYFEAVIFRLVQIDLGDLQARRVVSRYPLL